MNLVFIYEHWHIPDGNCPALAVGDEARLSIDVDVTDFGPSVQQHDEVTQLTDADYDIAATVLRMYADGVSSPFSVLEAGWLRFYCPLSTLSTLKVGDRGRLRGTLALDHYLWVELLDRHPHPPDLFHNVRVVIPSKWVDRKRRTVRTPTCLRPSRYGPEDVQDVTVVGATDTEPSFSLVEVSV